MAQFVKCRLKNLLFIFLSNFSFRLREAASVLQLAGEGLQSPPLGQRVLPAAGFLNHPERCPDQARRPDCPQVEVIVRVNGE